MTRVPTLTIGVFLQKRGRRYVALLSVPQPGFPRPWSIRAKADEVADAIEGVLEELKHRARPLRQGRKPGGFDIARRMVGGGQLAVKNGRR
jgi:hypothetical protein